MKPTSEKDPCAGNTGPSGKHSHDSADYPTATLSSTAMLKAKLAQAGFVVYTAQGGGFDVIRVDWGQCRFCKDEAELKSFAQKVGVFHV